MAFMFLTTFLMAFVQHNAHAVPAVSLTSDSDTVAVSRQRLLAKTDMGQEFVVRLEDLMDWRTREIEDDQTG